MKMNKTYIWTTVILITGPILVGILFGKEVFITFLLGTINGFIITNSYYQGVKHV